MRIASACALLVAASSLAAQPTRPEFELTSSAAGGKLAWVGHTVDVDSNTPVPKDDHIVDDAQAKVYDIGLTWNTEPDAKTGEMLAATFFWRLPKGELTGPRYVISAERSTPDGIVFTLRQDGNEKIVRRSPVCRLGKAFICRLEDLAKHVTLLKLEDIDPGRKNSANKPPLQTPTSGTPAASAPVAPPSGAPGL